MRVAISPTPRPWPGWRGRGGSCSATSDNPNGSLNDIAGVCNERGNVVGLMPHPEHNVEPSPSPSLDGRPFFASVLDFLGEKV